MPADPWRFIAPGEGSKLPKLVVPLLRGAEAIWFGTWPIGNTGCRLVVSLIHEMEKRNLTRGMASLCGGGGNTQAIIVERTD